MSAKKFVDLTDFSSLQCSQTELEIWTCMTHIKLKYEYHSAHKSAHLLYFRWNFPHFNSAM